MNDPNFARSVVLLVEHGPEGAMGLVINQPSEVSLASIGKTHNVDVPPSAGVAFYGGPVQRERGFLLHRVANAPESVEVLEGLWLSFSTKSLTALLRGDRRPGAPFAGDRTERGTRQERGSLARAQPASGYGVTAIVTTS